MPSSNGAQYKSATQIPHLAHLEHDDLGVVADSTKAGGDLPKVPSKGAPGEIGQTFGVLIV